MFPLRLLFALCAAPLLVAAFVGVAWLALRVHPSYLLLGLVCAGLALALGCRIHSHFADQGSAPLAFVMGLVLVATVLAGYVVAFNSVAPQHTCTVTEERTWKRYSPGGYTTYTHRRLACADGRTDSLGSELTARQGKDTTDKHDHTRLLVAYDPNGRLPSLDLDDQFWWVVWAIFGMALVTAVHAGVVISGQRRR
ncbi:hypothetical protein MMF93_32655 [Streptomyces tubbatahanensis]|uniref:Uncharacterized protein n=1 Tax=Streptomyces tubbatahanensis TaxID=2923272 RepID=A0ABY3Y2A0_9ACTN|nr:hypothetical protein [Streptomyces tubbatahanensis]UNT00709.1 hypothetical protein MMF93_32655 [Streptomyces tubbatahanensis]